MKVYKNVIGECSDVNVQDHRRKRRNCESGKSSREHTHLMLAQGSGFVCAWAEVFKFGSLLLLLLQLLQLLLHLLLTLCILSLVLRKCLVIGG